MLTIKEWIDMRYMDRPSVDFSETEEGYAQQFLQLIEKANSRIRWRSGRNPSQGPIIDSSNKLHKIMIDKDGDLCANGAASDCSSRSVSINSFMEFAPVAIPDDFENVLLGD